MQARMLFVFAALQKTLWFMYDEQTVDHAGPICGTPAAASAEAVSLHDLKRDLFYGLDRMPLIVSKCFGYLIQFQQFLIHEGSSFFL